jgi:hypothetical protein
MVQKCFRMFMRNLFYRALLVGFVFVTLMVGPAEASRCYEPTAINELIYLNYVGALTIMLSSTISIIFALMALFSKQRRRYLVLTSIGEALIAIYSFVLRALAFRVYENYYGYYRIYSSANNMHPIGLILILLATLSFTRLIFLRRESNLARS